MMIILQAQLPDVSNEILALYNSIRPQWFAAVWPAAKQLFFLLCLIDFSIAGGRLMRERHSLEEWMAGLLKQTLIIGAFYALLVFGVDWIGAIISSFQQIGIRGSGVADISPGDIFFRGLNIGAAIMEQANAWAYLTNFAGALGAVFSGLITMICFALIATAYLMVLLESFLVLTCGLIFLGFGGSSMTQNYVERYIAFGIATGVKLMLLYFLIGTGMVLSAQWLEAARGLSGAAVPGISAAAIMCSALILLLLIWQIPKLFSSILSGSPSLTGGDLIGAAATVAGATYVAGSMATRLGSYGPVGGGAAGGNQLSAGGSGSSNGSGNPAPRSSPVGATVPTNVKPPSNGGGNGGGGGRSSVGTMAKAGLATRYLPHEGGAAPSPPKMPIEDKD